ncbi:hypothetical protein EVG20_g3390 [Dentipellis fragilis]|uniref:Uncharacterized protein n=1 Tax=Dentipellis fragilis TaxID=205917 RepID=A0A4Y9Z458_9AGAM|nr:hypothetical protein EVG20_g3390 [Dentipellis fragilis]
MATRRGAISAVSPLDEESPSQDGDQTVDMDAPGVTSTAGVDQHTEGHAMSSALALDTPQDIIDISRSGSTDVARDRTSRSGIADVAGGFPSHSGSPMLLEVMMYFSKTTTAIHGTARTRTR